MRYTTNLNSDFEIMLDDLSLFVTIVEEGSLSAAAHKLDLPGATVTRRLRRLEDQLGCRLLSRSARRMQTTAEGAQYYEQCRPLVHALRQTTQRLEATFGTVAGSIRVLAPVNFGSGVLTDAWASFLLKFPEVQLDLKLSNAIEDLIGSGADIAIRIGSLNDSSLTQRRLARVESIVVAAPAYLARSAPVDRPEAFQDHSLIVADPFQEWELRHPPTGARFVVQPSARFRVSNEMNVAVAMARAGIGILFCPMTQCRHELDNGTLVRLLPEWTTPPREVYAVWAQQRFLPARVRALLDHLVEFAQSHPLLSTSNQDGQR